MTIVHSFQELLGADGQPQSNMSVFSNVSVENAALVIEPIDPNKVLTAEQQEQMKAVIEVLEDMDNETCSEEKSIEYQRSVLDHKEAALRDRRHLFEEQANRAHELGSKITSTSLSLSDDAESPK